MKLKRLLSLFVAATQFAVLAPLSFAQTQDPAPEILSAEVPPALSLESTAGTEGDFSEENVTLRFAVLSDMQFGRNNTIGKKFKSALQQIKARTNGGADLDAILFGGDLSDHAKASEFDEFLKILNEEFDPATRTTQMLYVRGNHDCYDDANPGQTFVNKIGVDPHYTAEINGYQFILCGQDNKKSTGDLHDPSTLTWLEEQLQAASAADPSGEKPIFVGVHPHINDTVYGSSRINGIKDGKPFTAQYWGANSLNEIIAPYKQAVTFSGHSHYPITDERSIFQGTYTSIGTGAVSYAEFENCWDENFHPGRFQTSYYGDGSFEFENVGYIIEVNKENQVKATRLDFARSKEIKQPWIIDFNKENWQVYTNDRDQTPPYFPEDAWIEIQNLKETGCRVAFKQAKDDESDVHRYTVEIFNKETGDREKIYTPFSYYHMNSTMPESNWWDVTKLQPNTEYTAKVTAYDSFDNASEPIEAEFKTPERNFPSAITQVGFTLEGALDSSPYAAFYGMQPTEYGTVPVQYNTELKRYDASFARVSDTTESPNFFKVKLDDGRRKLMQTASGYTIEAYFKSTAFNGGDNIIGAAQSSGFDLETTSAGAFEAYLHHNGSYVTPHPGSGISLTKEQYEHIVVTYDYDNSIVSVYQNGVLKDTQAATGALGFSDAIKADPYYGMVIGGDYKPATDADQDTAQNAFTGTIAFANLYSSALSAKEVAQQYAQIEARKALTKADDLNTALTETLPAARTEENGAAVDRLLAEGWNLMNSNTLTDSQIVRFLKKAEDIPGFPAPFSYDGAQVTADFKNYGFIYDNTNVTWTPQQENNNKSIYRPATRFTLRSMSGKDADSFLKMDFQKDTINAPAKFDSGTYRFAMEFSMLHKESGNFNINLLGKDSTGAERKAAQIVLKESGDTTYTNAARGYAVDKNGARIGDHLVFKAQTDNDRDIPATLLYLQVELDLENQTYSAWLLPRKTESGPYYGTQASDSSLLVKDQPFHAEGIEEFSGVSFDIKASSSTNGLWLHTAQVTQTKAPLTGTIEIDQDSLTSGTARAQAVVSGGNPEEAVILYAALYDQEGRLTQAIPYKKAVSDLDNTIDASIQLPGQLSGSLRFYLWTDGMRPLDMQAQDLGAISPQS